MKNTKIVFVSHGNTTNGGELCLAETVKALIDYGGLDVVVFIPGPGRSYLEKMISQYGAIVKPLCDNPRWIDHKLNFKEKWIRSKSTIVAFIKFWGIVRNLKPALVISNTIVSSPAFSFASKLQGCKHAWYIHELGDKDHGYYYCLGKRLTWAIVKLLSDKIIINSRFTLSYFNKKKAGENKKIRVINYAISIERFIKNDPGFEKCIIDKWSNTTVWKILVAGRTEQGKGQEDIIDALGILKNQYHVTNFFLTILGESPGAYLNKLRQIISKHNLHKHIDILPFTDSPGKYYKEAHIGVTTSRNEGFGRITVEYMKSNMVVIGARAGATPEIIEDNSNGYLYELGNILQFAEILKVIMANAVASCAMALKGKVAAEKRYNLTTHGNEIMDFLFE